MQNVVDTKELLLSNNMAAEEYHADRRGFLKHGLLFTAALGFWTPDIAQAAPSVAKGRTIKLLNAHTGEKFQGEYWYDGKYDSGAFGEIKALMRDFRTGEKFPIDPRLMDIMYVLQHRADSTNAYRIFSGYRSPKTNAKLRRLTKGVARNSLHMQGQAADISLPGTRLSHLRKTAISLHAVGVGYYPNSSFMHIDTGRVRSW